MANGTDGLGWANDAPAAVDLRSNGYVEIRSIRKGVNLRLDKEHVALATMSSGPDLSSGGGEHKPGSAMAYFKDGSPALLRPDGVTTLTSADKGRLAVDTTGSSFVMKVYDHDTTSFVNTSGTQQASGTLVPSVVVASPQTVTVGFTPDLFWFGFGSPPTSLHNAVVSLASLSPVRAAYFVIVSQAHIQFEMVGSDVLITVAEDANGYFAGKNIAHWRALKF